MDRTNSVLDHGESGVKTRLLIISDTHAREFPDDLDISNITADVAIHCGDLTENSKLSEFSTSLRILKGIKAPLKLVIAGNHDSSLDKSAFEAILLSNALRPEDEAVKREFGTHQAVRDLFSADVPGEGQIVLVDEGTHHFDLANGAAMTVFASPYTPSETCSMGFQYRSSETRFDDEVVNDGHDWRILDGTDIVITHGPPRGIFDRTLKDDSVDSMFDMTLDKIRKERTLDDAQEERIERIKKRRRIDPPKTTAKRVGSQGLFAAVAKAKPLLHCFGHIHEGWGAREVTWRSNMGDAPSHLTHIDNDKSSLLESLATLHAGKFDSEEEAARKREKLRNYQKKRACFAESPGRGHTLFVNAAIEGNASTTDFQLPWVVDLVLSKKSS